MTNGIYHRNREARPADFIIKIYDYQNRIVEGNIEFIPTGENISFFGLTSFLESIQDKLDECGHPQNTLAIRTWDIKQARERPEMNDRHEERPPVDIPSRVLASFMLRIQFRQNAGWQGNLAWLEGRRSMTFRSVLELTGLLDQAVQHAANHSRATPASGNTFKWKARESVS